MARLGYGALLPPQFVGFLGELTEGAWAAVPVLGAERGEPSLDATPLLPFFKTALTRSINRVVIVQGAANDVGSVDVEWSQAERRFVLAVQLLALDKDPEVAQAAARVQKVLCDGGGTAMVRQSADAKVDFARNQLAVAATPDVAPLVARLGLRDKLDDIRECTDDLADAVRASDDAKERLPRSRRIERATTACAAAFNWVHEGLTMAAASARDASTREELQALLAPFERLLARRSAEETAASEAPEALPEPEPKPLAPTG